MIVHDHIVFVIDDDIRIQEALEELLASHGIHAVVFGSAGEYIDAEKPDVASCLVLDVELPDINGLELVQFMRKSAPHAKTPVILISTEASARDQERGLAIGANAFLSKPLGADALQTLVRETRAAAER